MGAEFAGEGVDVFGGEVEVGGVFFAVADEVDGVVVGGCVDVDVLDVVVGEEVLEDAEACGVAGVDVGEFVDLFGGEVEAVVFLEMVDGGGG